MPITDTSPAHRRPRLATLLPVFATAMLAARPAGAFDGSASWTDLVVLLGFVVDVWVGPASLFIVVLVCALRSGWGLGIAVLAGINLVIAATMLVLGACELGVLTPLFLLQAALSTGVLVVGRQPAWRRAVFGADPPSRPAG